MNSSETTTNDVLAGVDLSGRRAMITGATGGIGLETARALAVAGAHVVLGARDLAKGTDAVAAIKTKHPDVTLDVVALDLTSFDNIRGCASRMVEQGHALDLLVNNAGVMFPPLTRTNDGFELQFATNHLGHFVLTAALMPLLVAHGARVVNVSSAGHSMGEVNFDDPNFEHRAYDKFVGYGQSKTANILFARACDQRFGDVGVRSFSLHPGMIATDLGRHMTGDDFTFMIERAKRNAEAAASQGARPPSGAGEAGAMPAFKTIEQGAATSVYACVAPELAERGGTYLSDCAIAQPSAWADSDENAERLWTLSEALTGVVFK